MKDYIGVVVVKAEPSEKGGKPGYSVQLSDGATYWASKEDFEEAYRELYTRSYTIGADMLGKLSHEVKHRNGPDHEFDVRGYYRRYKSGKVVWIKPHTRCKGRGERRDRTYIAKVKEEKT